MNDPLKAYLKKHQPMVPAAPEDEWERILARTRRVRGTRQAWIYVSALTLSAAGLMAFLNVMPRTTEDEIWLKPEDVVYREKVENPVGAYQDWLWLAEHVGADPGE